MEVFLDRLCAADLRGDRERFRLLTELQAIYRGSLARQRMLVMDRLKDILATHAKPYKFKAWQRLVAFK